MALVLRAPALQVFARLRVVAILEPDMDVQLPLVARLWSTAWPERRFSRHRRDDRPEVLGVRKERPRGWRDDFGRLRQPSLASRRRGRSSRRRLHAGLRMRPYEMRPRPQRGHTGRRRPEAHPLAGW